MKNEAVKVRREMIEKCMKCSLCNQLFTDATTICESLHTFCKECISKKLSDEEFECCPKCETDLGSVPMHKSRSDPNIQELRAKIFASKKRKIDTNENMPSATSTPEVTTQSPDTSNSPEGKMPIHPWFSNLMGYYGVTITPDIYRLFELDKFTDQSAEKIEAEAAAFLNDGLRVEPFGGLFTVFCHYSGAVLEMEEGYYQLISDYQKLKAELALFAPIAAENQKLRAELVASKAANSALSDVKRRLIAKEAEVDELQKMCDNFCLGISNVENELKKIKQSISK